MADYQLTTPDENGPVIRTADGASIPADPANRDYNGGPQSPGYLQWVEAGGVPDPYVAPPEPAPAPPTPEQEVLFDHENRLRSMEGQPPLTQEEFASQRK